MDLLEFVTKEPQGLCCLIYEEFVLRAPMEKD